MESKTWNMSTTIFAHKIQTWKPQVILPSKRSCEWGCVAVHRCSLVRILTSPWQRCFQAPVPMPHLQCADHESAAEGLSQGFCNMLLFVNHPSRLTDCSIRGHWKRARADKQIGCFTKLHPEKQFRQKHLWWEMDSLLSSVRQYKHWNS